MSIELIQAHLQVLVRLAGQMGESLRVAHNTIANSHDSVNANWPDDSLRSQYDRFHSELESSLQLANGNMQNVLATLEQKLGQAMNIN